MFSIFFGSWSYGQDISSKGWFEIDYDTACVPFTVNVNKLLATSPGQTVFYKYDANETIDNQYTYSQPGTYKIEVIIASAPGRVDSINVVLHEAKQPEFSLYTCKSNKVYVDIEDNYYEKYQVDFGDGQSVVVNNGQNIQHQYAIPGSYTISVTGLFIGSKSNCGVSSKSISTLTTMEKASIISLSPSDASTAEIFYNINSAGNYTLAMAENGGFNFITIDTLTDPSSVTIPNLDLVNNFYCFKIVAFDPCDNQKIDSDIICSVKTRAVAENNQNRITWDTWNHDPATNELIRNSSTLGNQNTNSYIDSNLECSTSYCYQNVISYLNGSRSFSLPICVIAVSNDIPEPVSSITSSILGEDIRINWQAPSTFVADTYFLARSINGEPFELIDSVTTTSYVDSNTDVSKDEHCYEIFYRDKCGNTSPKTISCPILLKQGSGMTFNWSEYAGWSPGVQEYLIEKLDGSGSLQMEESVGQVTTYEVVSPVQGEQVMYYRIKAISNNPALISYSNIVSAIFPSKAVFPTAFTPNGDGLNDEFRVIGLFIESFDIKIYNRWGELVFHSDNKDNGWKGYYRDGKKLASEGVYAYVATYTDQTGKSFKKSGSVLLLRKN